MIRPIDLNLNIQHAADAARVGTNQNQGRPEVAAQQFADRLEKQTKEQNEQVQRQEPTDKANVNPDDKGHGGYAQKKKPAKKKTEEKKKAPARAIMRTTGESMFDIRI